MKTSREALRERLADSADRPALALDLGTEVLEVLEDGKPSGKPSPTLPTDRL